MSKIPVTKVLLRLLLLLATPGCISGSLNNRVGGLFSTSGQSMVTYSSAVEVEGMPWPGVLLGVGARLLGAEPDDDNPYWQFHLATGYSSWRMPGPRIVEWEATVRLGYGELPPGNGQPGEWGVIFGPHLSLPIRVYPPAAPLWRLDRLTSIVVYVVPNLGYNAAYLPGPEIWRHEVVHGVGLRFQLYSAVLP